MTLDVRPDASAPPVQRWFPDVLERLRKRRVPVLLLSPAPIWDGPDRPRPDLLVRPSRFPIALRTLSVLGFGEPVGARPPWPSLNRSIREGARLTRADGASIEVAHHVRPWVWGRRLPFDDLDRRCVVASVAGLPVRSVDPAAGVLIAALLLADGRGEDRSGDVLALAAACEPNDVVRLARQTRLDGVVAAILATLPERQRPSELLEALAARTNIVNRFRLDRLTEARRAGPLASALTLPTPNAVAMLAATMVPSPALVERRYGSRFAYDAWWRDAFVDGRRRALRERSMSGGRAEAEPEPPAHGAAPVERAKDGTGLRGPGARARSLFPKVGPVTAASLFHGIDGAPVAPGDPRAWDDELEVLLRHRLSGLALAHAERHGVRLSPDTRSSLHEAHLRNVARALTVESTAVKVLDVLEPRSIPYVVTKGPGVALTYPEPSLRPYGDIDVLVPPDRFQDAMRALASIGFEEYFGTGEPRAYFDGFCREGVNLIRPDGGSIDLHHRIPPWVWGERLAFPRLFARSRRIDVAGGRIRTLDPTHNVLVAALHVISDRRDQPGSKLITWRDVVSLARACDPERVVAEARRVELDWYLAFILRQVPRSVRPEHLVDRLGRPHPSSGDAFRLRRLLPPALGSRHQIAQVFRLPAPNAMAFLGGYIVPSRDFLRKRYGRDGGYVRWWREATGRLRDARDLPLEGSRGSRV